MTDTSYRVVSFLVPRTGRDPFTHVALRVAPPLTPLEVTSPGGARGPWLPAYTAETPSSSPGPRVAVQGLSLSWKVNESLQGEVTFSGVSPLTLEQIVTQINTSPLLRAFHAMGQLYLYTPLVGASASLEVPSSEAAEMLGLPVDTKVYGTPAEARLVPGVELVQIANPQHVAGALYQYRLTNPLLGVVGEWSSPFPVEQTAPPDTVEGHLKIQDNAGVAKGGRSVVMQLASEQIDPGATTFYTNDPLLYRSDSTGLVKVPLVRGLRYIFSVEGARWTRTVLAPVDTSVESFDLLDPTYSTEVDLWALQSPELPGFYARRNLG